MKLRAVLGDVRPYHPPRLREEISVDRGSDEYVKLTMNELSFGPLPVAKEAVVEALAAAAATPTATPILCARSSRRPTPA